MHRSGTSATAGALQLSGVALGSRLLAAGADNPKGYFEHERAVRINERLLERLGSRWDDVRELPEAWRESEPAREALAAMDALIEEEFSGERLWALKDPRLCRLMPLWLEALRRRNVRPVVLFVARDPSEVAASLAARNGWTPALGELLWLRYMLDAEAATRGLGRTAIAYEALLADPLHSLGAAMERLGVDLPAPPAEALHRFVEAGDRHQRRERLIPGDGIFAQAITQASEALARIAHGEDDWSSLLVAGEGFAHAWEAAGGYIDGVAAMASSFDAEARAARIAAATVRSQLDAQVEWARHAVRKHETLQADNAGLQSELAAQLAWSEAAVREREALQAEAAQLRSELKAQLAWSDAAVLEREALQAEVAQLRSGLAAQVRWSEQAVVEWAERAERYEQSLVERAAEVAARDAELAAIRHSLAWRLSRPLRALESLANRTNKRSSGKQR